jgi:hypothetical protein
MTASPVAERKYQLPDRPDYAPVEIAYVLGVQARTVRSYLKRNSKKHPGQKLLPANRDEMGHWRITREGLAIFLDEMFGDHE